MQACQIGRINGVPATDRGAGLVKIVVHIGVHRTATTTFQHFMRTEREVLSARGIGFWGPHRTRKGLLSGLMPRTQPAFWGDAEQRLKGRVALNLAKSADLGVETLIISDENMCGSVRSVVQSRKLYPAIGERMARLYAAFDGRIDRLVISVRALELWWQSAVSYGVLRGADVPDRAACAAISASPRSWQDVIVDIACAMPGVDLQVLPYEATGAHPEAVLAVASGYRHRRTTPAAWRNPVPTQKELRQALQERGSPADMLGHDHTRWQPFTERERATLRECYADDLFWLRAGADGLATLTEMPEALVAKGSMTRGNTQDVGQTGHMA